MNSYKFLKITDFELKVGTGMLQPDPQKDLNRCNRELGSPVKKSRDSPAEFRGWRSPAASVAEPT
jgi:hypothetical protein